MDISGKAVPAPRTPGPHRNGGYFLSRCPGRPGECLAFTGQVIGVGEATGYGLVDVKLQVAQLPPSRGHLVA